MTYFGQLSNKTFVLLVREYDKTNYKLIWPIIVSNEYAIMQNSFLKHNSMNLWPNLTKRVKKNCVFMVKEYDKSNIS